MVLVVSFDSNVLVLPSVLEPGLDLGVAKTKSSCQAAALLDTAVYQDQFLLGPVSIDRYTNDKKSSILTTSANSASVFSTFNKTMVDTVSHLVQSQ